MKEIIYNDNKFLLTDEEFAKAIVCWNEKRSFYSLRLEQLLTPYFKHAGTAKEELNYEVYYLWTTERGQKVFEKIFKREDKYFREITKGGDKVKIEVALGEEELENLIPHDVYYKNNLYLKSPEDYDGRYGVKRIQESGA